MNAKTTVMNAVNRNDLAASFVMLALIISLIIIRFGGLLGSVG